MSLNEVNRLLLSFHDLHQGIRHIFFADGFRLFLNTFGFSAHFHNQRAGTDRLAAERVLEFAVLRHIVLLRDLRLLVGVNEFVGDLIVLCFVQLQQIFGRTVLAARIERFDSQILLYLLDDIH